MDLLLNLQEKGELPIRIVHNDTKINNVMLDAETDRAVCVIDLDTVMPGSVLYDFGDMVRTMTSPAAEDEEDLEKTFMRMPMFEAVVKGYLETRQRFYHSSGSFPASLLRQTDHAGNRHPLPDGLSGRRRLFQDGKRPAQLHRGAHPARSLVKSMEQQMPEMEKLCADVFKAVRSDVQRLAAVPGWLIFMMASPSAGLLYCRAC